MDTPQDEVLRSPKDPGEQRPRIPDPFELRLPDEEVRRLQTILNSLGGKEWTFEEARLRGLELLSLTLLLIDPEGYQYWQRHPSALDGLRLEPPVPSPPPVPQPFPIRLDADHPREIASNLKMLQDELRWVKRRPTSWRWALVDLYNAVGHTLAAHRPAGFLPYSGPAQVTKLFDAVATERREIAPAREAVEQIERLRCTWIARAVSGWPTSAAGLRSLFSRS